MGQCLASPPQPKNTEFRLSNMIQNDINDRAEADERQVKLLLLGAGESGKTTLFKQMGINYGKDSFQEKLRGAKTIILTGFITAFVELMRATIESHGTLETEALDDALENLLHMTREKDQSPEPIKKISPELAAKMIEAWRTANVQDVWKHRWKYQVTDSLGYFCESINRIADPNYAPTEEDYLYARVRTTGVQQQPMTYKNVEFLIMDVGGQRNERRKWLQCFDQLTGVIFVASISEFDQQLFEDNNVKRLTEAMDLFKKILGFQAFVDIPIILLLNKKDIFMEKMARLRRTNTNLDEYFPELKRGTNYEGAEDAVMEHIKNQFLKQRNGTRPLYCSFVTATEKTTFLTVFDKVAEIVLSDTVAHHFHNM